MKSSPILAFVLGFVLATSAAAQRPSKQQTERKVVPPDSRPPAGMCRVWIDGVPADRQPAPTDCASALRSRPARGEVLFGDDYAHGDTAKRNPANADSPLKGVAPLPKAMEAKPPADSSHVVHKADDVHKKVDGRKPDHRPDSTDVIEPGTGTTS